MITVVLNCCIKLLYYIIIIIVVSMLHITYTCSCLVINNKKWTVAFASQMKYFHL